MGRGLTHGFPHPSKALGRSRHLRTAHLPRRPASGTPPAPRGPMRIQQIFAVACVSDMDRSAAWYAALLGREADDRPMDGLAQWRFGAGAGLQLVLDPGKAGCSLVTIITPSLAAARARLRDAGLRLEDDVQGDFGLLAQVSDPDGNRLTLAEPPTGLEAGRADGA